MTRKSELTVEDYKHNEKMMILDGMGWASGFELINAGSIVSVFIYTLTGSVTLAGLATTLQTGGMMLGQLFAGPSVSKINDGGKVAGIYGVFSKSLFALAILSILLPFSPLVIATIFLSLFFFSWLFQGAGALVWMDMFPRMIRREVYGKILGLRGTYGYIVAFFVGLLVKSIMGSDEIAFKIKYVIIMGMGIAILSLTIIAIIALRDAGPKNRVISHTVGEMLKDLPSKIKLEKCRHFRKFLVVRIFGFFSDAMLPFILVFTASNGLLSASEIATLVFIKILGSLAGAYVGGKLTDKIGAHIVIIIQFVSRFIMAITCIVLVINPDTSWMVYIFVVILTGIGMQGMMSYNTYSMCVTPDEIRPDMLLVNAIMGLPFAVLALILGSLADNVGFLPLFIGMGVFSIIAIILSWILLLNKKQQQEFLDGI